MIRFFFEYNRQIIQLPVNPETLEVPSKVKNDSAEILTLGQVSIAGNVQLKEFKIASFLPNKNKYPFILTDGKFKEPDFYIDFFNKVLMDKQPMKVVITDTNVNMDVLISNFKYSYNAQDDDIEFELSLVEYKPYSVKTYALEQTVQPVATETIRKATEPCVGSKVVVNGQLFADSYGGGPGKILSNYNGIISIIKKGRPKPYHIINSSGGWMGWVAESSIKDSGEISDVKMNASTSSSTSDSVKQSGQSTYGNSSKTSTETGSTVRTSSSGTQHGGGGSSISAYGGGSSITTTSSGSQHSGGGSIIYGSEKKTNIPTSGGGGHF